MTNLNNFGICPCCKSKFDVKAAAPAFGNSFPGNTIKFIYGLCPNCFKTYSKSSVKTQSKIRTHTRDNFFSNPNENYSIVDSLSLKVRGNFLHAWHFGCGLPPIVVEAINKNLITEIAILPGMAEVHHE